ncbi:uncharacterized protein LOC107981491 [Nasonia vitripennis]|uniref:Uncharacterized protein n=1 Tax=Nasonia vitripennis TaxID=7425 RepID=A0A7M7IS85_NASVI|nr:uncharacterized protein LOC107981491 [Nasonia vitripennis]
MDKLQLLRMVLTVLSAVLREPITRMVCREGRRRSFKHCSVNVLLKQLKFILDSYRPCPIMYLFKRSLLESEVDVIRALGELLGCGMQDAWQVQAIMQQYRLIQDLDKMMADTEGDALIKLVQLDNDDNDDDDEEEQKPTVFKMEADEISSGIAPIDMNSVTATVLKVEDDDDDEPLPVVQPVNAASSNATTTTESQSALPAAAAAASDATATDVVAAAMNTNADQRLRHCQQQ